MSAAARRSFFDTTIAIYAASDEDAKGEIARRLLRSNGNVISAQVLNEFVSVGRGKLKWEWVKIREALTHIRAQAPLVLPLTVETHELSVRLAERYRFNIYDTLILASALEAGCDVLYSEDMQHGQVIDGLTIHNPFR